MTEHGHTLRAHSPWGASGTHLWMNCPAALRMQEGIHEGPKPHAEEGTAAHELAEACLLEGLETLDPDAIGDPFDYLGKVFNGYEVTRGMAEAVQEYTEAIREDWKTHGGCIAVEARFDLSEHVRPEMFGSNDCVLYDCDDGVLRVYDYKHGAGVPVEVEENPQLMYYGLGAMYRFNLRGVEAVELIIAQPRCPHDDGPIRRWRTGVVAMMDFEYELGNAVDRTKLPDAEPCAGWWCAKGFCKAQAFCPANEKAAMEVAMTVFGDDGSLEDYPPDPDDIDTDRLGEILRELPVLEKWCKAVRAFAQSQLEAGNDVLGWKLVHGRSSRVFEDPNEVERHLLGQGYTENDIYTERKLLTPAQIEKLVGKKTFREELDDYVKKLEGRLTIAEATDKRPAASSSAIAAFSDFDIDE